MKKVRYSGPSVSLGRFGTVKDGGTLDLLDSEWGMVKDDGRFSLIEDYTETLRPYAGALPLGCPSCDLRAIPWNHERFHAWLGARSFSFHASIITALSELGIPVRVKPHDRIEFLRDTILSFRELAGWASIPTNKRLRLPTLDDAAHRRLVERVDSAASALNAIDPAKEQGKGTEPDSSSSVSESDAPPSASDSPSSPPVARPPAAKKVAAKKAARKRGRTP